MGKKTHRPRRTHAASGARTAPLGRVKPAEAEGRVARKARRHAVVVAPVSGSVAGRHVQPGETGGLDAPLVTVVEITAPLHYPLTPLPEGDSYLGFIFARGETPAEVEAALRAAHGCLRFTIEPLLPLL